jgi:hypothetical protein
MESIPRGVGRGGLPSCEPHVLRFLRTRYLLGSQRSRLIREDDFRAGFSHFEGLQMLSGVATKNHQNDAHDYANPTCCFLF